MECFTGVGGSMGLVVRVRVGVHSDQKIKQEPHVALAWFWKFDLELLRRTSAGTQRQREFLPMSNVRTPACNAANASLFCNASPRACRVGKYRAI